MGNTRQEVRVERKETPGDDSRQATAGPAPNDKAHREAGERKRIHVENSNRAIQKRRAAASNADQPEG